MNDSYAAIGGRFEYLNCDCGYEQWSQYLIKTLEELGAGRRGIDLGCGNGYFTRALAKHGKDMLGADISPQMLSTAKELAAKQGVRAEFLLCDITKLKLASRVDFAVAINDCFNYIPQSKLKNAFLRVAASLIKGGAFVFDISSEYKLKNIIGNNLFAEDNDDTAYMWFNRLEEDRVIMDLTVFTAEAGGLFKRADEQHVQYIHSKEAVICALESAGFKVLRTEGHLGAPLESQSQRINFVCERI